MVFACEAGPARAILKAAPMNQGPRQMMQQPQLKRAPVAYIVPPRGGARNMASELSSSQRTIYPDDAATLLFEFLNGCSSGCHAALGELLQSLDYANQLELSEWDFAVDLSSFHRLNLSDSDLRWLISTGYVRHAIEKTSPADDFRRFVNSKTLAVGRKSCFVLTEKGAAASRAILKHYGSEPRRVSKSPANRLHDTPPASLRPHWDRDQQELRLGSIIIKKFRVPAASQEMVLAAFEEEHWPPRIDDPLPPHRNVSQKRRLQETIRSLNRNQKHPLIRFLGDGNAKGVLWTLLNPNLLHEPL
jgi:hypothetical protein